MGTRIFDLNCGWPMYREPYNGSFRYKCGLYQQSHGQKCRHNHADGLVATKFTLSCIRQKLLKLMPQVERRLRALAAASATKVRSKPAADGITAELASVQADLKVVSSNLARAKSDEQYQAISNQFDQLNPGAYKLYVEAAREVGGREIVSIPFQWPPAKAEQAQVAGASELGEVRLELKP